ncbi:hypothetical protein DMUE_3682 [Dictyocoela muelleri]|nr:hypothetical protein DMUE_3682 [Dictyocoela muelleri]
MLSINGGKFLDYDSGCLDPERLLIFINSEKIMHLENSSIWLGDGTFKMAPSGFFQIYIIYAKIFENFFPLLYAILPNKTEKTYLKFFAIVAKLIKNNCPNYIIMDFKIALIKAFREIFPLTKVFNCFFHFSQNILKYIQKSGLVVRYKKIKNSEFI